MGFRDKIRTSSVVYREVGRAVEHKMFARNRYFTLSAIFIILACRVAVAQEAAVLTVPGKGDDLSAKIVRETIDGAVLYLKSTQLSGGGWTEADPHLGGISALCTLALLNAGVTPDDPHMARALAYLRKIDPTSSNVKSNYVTSLQTMVFCLADPKKDAKIILRNVRWLIKAQKTEGVRAGAWSYPDGAGDPSNSQFALLALHEAERAGMEIPDTTWDRANAYWRKTQNMDGSWPYLYLPPSLERQNPGTGSMTCAGIVSMLIASEKSQPADARVAGEHLVPCKRQETDDSKRIRHGQRWMSQHFSVARNPGNKEWLYYYLYGMERMGRMTSQRFIGEHDWFRAGTNQIVRTRRTKAVGDKLVVYWKGDQSSEMIEPIATSLALLFLSKGRLPVLVTKVQFSEDEKDTDWDQHRHDTVNLTAYVEKAWKRNLTTQHVKLAPATVEDLLQSPVLYISGVNSPLPGNVQRQQEYARKLRDYVDRGGFIVAEAVAPGGSFDAGFQRLVKLMFPEDTTTMHPMPLEHPIWRAEVKIPQQFMRPVYCMDHGCRTCVVFIPSQGNPRPSLSCTWELAGELKRKNREKHPESVIAEIEAGLAMGLNILSYATNRELKTKDETLDMAPEQDVQNTAVQRGRLAMANLRHGGGCDVAPNALRNLLSVSARNMNIRSGILEKTISITSPELFDYPVVFLQGRGSFRLTPQEKQQLRLYIQRGGMIFANAICASASFDKAFRAEMAEILPENALTAIPHEDALLTPRYGGYDLSRVQVRRPPTEFAPPDADTTAASADKPQPPRLEGARFQDRYAVIYSPLDISCALEKQPGTCVGYSPEDAAKIGMNVILYSMQ